MLGCCPFPAASSEGDMAATLRAGTAADAESIAMLHVAIWQETYRDLAPAAAREALDLAMRLKRWRARLEQTDGSEFAVIAEVDGVPVGFGHCGPAGEAVFENRGEINSLYVDGRHGRQGFGRALMAEMTQFMMAKGYRRIGLGVVVGNDPAIAFYTRLGGHIAATYTDPGPLWRSQNYLMAWDDLTALIAACRR